MWKKTGTVVGLGLIVGVLAYFLLSPFFQTDVNRTVNSLVDKYQKAALIEETNYYDQTPIYQTQPINLDPNARILVESLRLEGPNLSIGNRDGQPLMETLIKGSEKIVEAASETEADAEAVSDSVTPESETAETGQPWFHSSPNVAIISPTSLVQKARLLRRENLNGFAWYMVDNEEQLFQFDQAYTGWHSTAFDGWHYYSQGIEQDDLIISSVEANELINYRNHLTGLVPLVDNRKFFIDQPARYKVMIESYPVNYSILYKASDQLVLTSPPGTYGSTLLTNTTSFQDMPMEVVEEVSTLSGDWLRVMIGYEDLGWIKKDEDYQDYVLTFYSEQELLAVIETVLIEELANISANAGASFVNNETMSQVSVNNQTFFPASTQKIYVLAELYHQYSEGELDPTDYIEMGWEDQVPGAGIIQSYAPGTLFTLDELVNLVAIYSDNTAANLLIDAVGGGSIITPHMHQLGFFDTYVDGKYYNAREGYFHTTPADAARLFGLLYNNRINGEPWDDMYIDKLFLNSHNFLRQFIPYTTTAWNKSGLGNPEQNDVATFVTPFGSYSLAVYTEEPWNYDAVGTQMGYLSLRVHEVFNEMRQQLWMTVEDSENYFNPESVSEPVDE